MNNTSKESIISVLLTLQLSIVCEDTFSTIETGVLIRVIKITYKTSFYKIYTISDVV